MQEAFQSVNTAFVHDVMVYILAFCLACIGTDNKFSADLILNHRAYILSECKKKPGIAVASFRALT